MLNEHSIFDEKNMSRIVGEKKELKGHEFASITNLFPFAKSQAKHFQKVANDMQSKCLQN